jgi:hypothetical protein
MPRFLPSGTPSRTNKYVYPRNRLFVFWVSLAVGIGIATLLTLAVLGGKKTVASPGPLSSAHAPFEAKCAACHSPAVADERCEYCHDPFGSNRLQNAGHVWYGTKNAALVAKAQTVDCDRCHGDHRGRAFPMKKIDERDCSRCHFPSFASHPQIALVKAGIMKGEGLKFPHARHLPEMQKANLERCQYCHEPTRDRRGFEQVSFDLHCFRCHAKGGVVGVTDPIARSVIVLPGDIGAPWAQALAGNVQKLPRDKVVVANLSHSDPWIIYNLWKLSREVDPDGLARKRAELAGKIDQLFYQLREPPTRGLAMATLKAEEKRLAAVERTAKTPADLKRARQALARVRIQIELGPLQMTAPRPRDRSQIQAELARRRSELSDFDIAASGPTSPLPPEEKEKRLAAVVAMTSACVKCHIYDGVLMQAVNAAKPVLDRARFNHLPHVQQKGCEFCHGMVVKSTKAENVNLPGIVNCQGCHRPSRSRDDCAECHRYHPPTEPWPPI